MNNKIYKLLQNKDKYKLANYNFTKKISKWNHIILLDKYTLEVYKKGIITDIQVNKTNIVVSILVNNKYTLHIDINNYYIFTKNDKTYLYKYLLESLS